MAGESSTVAIFGAGVMGEALLSGLLRGEEPGHRYLITEKRPDRVAELRERYPQVEVVDNVTAAKTADVLALVVKPQDMTALLDEIGEHIQEDALVVSLAAGITTTRLEESLPKSVAVVRAMPNTPAAVGRGVTGAVAGGDADPARLRLADALLGAVGAVEWLDEERSIDALTAVSGSGPAYVFYMVECLAAAGVAAGLPVEISNRIARATVEGAGELLYRQSDVMAGTLRERVTSPGGTTAAALAVLMGDEGLAPLMTRAVAAAQKRAGELSG